jgi:hypothetical protein
MGYYSVRPIVLQDRNLSDSTNIDYNIYNKVYYDLFNIESYKEETRALKEFDRVSIHTLFIDDIIEFSIVTKLYDTYYSISDRWRV